MACIAHPTAKALSRPLEKSGIHQPLLSRERVVLTAVLLHNICRKPECRVQNRCRRRKLRISRVLRRVPALCPVDQPRHIAPGRIAPAELLHRAHRRQDCSAAVDSPGCGRAINPVVHARLIDGIRLAAIHFPPLQGLSDQRLMLCAEVRRTQAPDAQTDDMRCFSVCFNRKRRIDRIWKAK